LHKVAVSITVNIRLKLYRQVWKYLRMLNHFKFSNI